MPSPFLPITIPASAGIGFRRDHEDWLLTGVIDVGWLEVHSENYFCAGGHALSALCAIREHYPLSLHGVGLSLGGPDPLDRTHIANLQNLIATVRPGFVSEHLSWGSIGGLHTNDLLPLPYTEEALAHFVSRVRQIQDALGRRILIENVSSYIRFEASHIPEPEFLVAVAQLSDCRLLLDVNNVYVNARNHDEDAAEYLDSIPGALIEEVHLAGHSINQYGDREILIDTHGDLVCADVWRLYERLVHRIGPRPTLIEWDTEVPALAVLVSEAERAEAVMEGIRARAA